MKYLTAIEASKHIGVSEKTIRLWIKEGKLQAHHPAKNRLAIAEVDVERIAKERQLYYGTRPEMTASIHTLPDISAHDIDTLFTRIAQLEHQPEISVLTRELGKLQAKVDVQQARIDELERRITELEGRNIPVHPIPPSTTSDIPPKARPQRSDVDASNPIPSDLPPGTLSASDFATILEIPYDHMRNYMRRGVNGEHLDITEIPHHTRPGYSYKYLDPEQQERAIELLRKHGKLDTN